MRSLLIVRDPHWVGIFPDFAWPYFLIIPLVGKFTCCYIISWCVLLLLNNNSRLSYGSGPVVQTPKDAAGINASYSPRVKFSGMKPFTGYWYPAADMVNMPLGTFTAAGCGWGEAHMHRGFPTEEQLQALQIRASGFDLSGHGLAAPTQVILRAGTGQGSSGSQPSSELLPLTLT